MSREPFALTITLDHDYQFSVDFRQPGVPALTVDEPEPLGQGQGPNPVRLLAAAVGNCLGSSLLFCFRKAHIEVTGLQVDVQGSTARNPEGRLRVEKLTVALRPQFADGPPARWQRCLEIFEDFCLVTQSVRDGLEVDVSVLPTPAEVPTT